MSTLVERIQSRLDATGKNASSVADEIGANRSLVRDILVGKSRNPGVETIRALCGPLECSLSYLVGVDPLEEEAVIQTAGKFWMVYGIGQREPRYHHYTAESAAKEAARLAGVYPEITFVVLETIDAYRSEKPVINKLEIVAVPEGKDSDDDLPF